MKNIEYKIVVLLFFLSANILLAQDVKSIFDSSNTSMEFLGLDFLQAKLVGVHDFNKSATMQDNYFDAWNDLFLSEKQKYDVRRAFVNQEMSFDFSMVKKRHEGLKLAEMVTNYKPESFSKEALQAIINSYDIGESESELGLSFVVHSLNKYQELACFYVVIFNIKTKNILFYEKLSGEAGGFGFRNYWARCVYNILEDIKDYYFKSWKNEVLAQE